LGDVKLKWIKVEFFFTAPMPEVKMFKGRNFFYYLPYPIKQQKYYQNFLDASLGLNKFQFSDLVFSTLMKLSLVRKNFLRPP